MTNPSPDQSGLNRGGRPKGTRNRSTVAAAASARAAALDLAQYAANMMPVDVMLHAMRTHLADGDLVSAVDAARAAAPYVHSRMSAVFGENPIPADLQPDPPSLGDEPAPPGGIIE